MTGYIQSVARMEYPSDGSLLPGDIVSTNRGMFRFELLRIDSLSGAIRARPMSGHLPARCRPSNGC